MDGLRLIEDLPKPRNFFGPDERQFANFSDHSHQSDDVQTVGLTDSVDRVGIVTMFSKNLIPSKVVHRGSSSPYHSDPFGVRFHRSIIAQFFVDRLFPAYKPLAN